MNSGQFARLREILLTAPRLPAAERESYLARVCSDDPELRREADSLLAVGEADVPDAARTGAGVAAAAEALGHAGPPAPLPDRIGPFRVVGLLGEGGMGVVYRALQTAPIHREVALKRVSGAGGGDVLERFEAERDALARMEHPGIARVLDAGRDEDGAPYFVMELVRGTPITRFCRDAGLSVRDRVRLLGDVCHAVQHAHQKGIVHRDLKPSNVLVTEDSGGPQPRVIDFGIAKAVGDGARAAGLTGEGQLVGTLEYMSPEQAAGRAADIDTRSDVYSLGVLLYELVSGSLPHDLRAMPLLDAARAVAADPPRAMARGDGGAVDADLEVITLKALAKDPDLRYESAAAMADDLGRWLQDLPVLARPPSTMYQLRKLVARNRVPFALGSLLVVALVVFGVTMTLLFQAQRTDRARAEAEAEKAREVSGFLQNMLSSVEGRGREVSVREILDVAARDVEQGLAGRPRVEAALRSTIGNAYAALSEFEKGQVQLEASLAVARRELGDHDPAVAEGLKDLAALHRAWSYGAESLARAASLAAEAAAVSRRDPESGRTTGTETVVLLARIRADQGRHAEADSLYREAARRAAAESGEGSPRVARIRQWHALPLHRLGRTEESCEALRSALRTFRDTYAGDHAAVAECLHDLSFVVPDREEKLALRIECVEMNRRLWGDGHANTAAALSLLGTTYANRRSFDRAVPLLREAYSITRRAFPADHVLVAQESNNLASALNGAGDSAEAATLYRTAYEIWRKQLGPRHRNVMICRTNLAAALDALGEDDEAWGLLGEGLEIACEASGPEGGDAALAHRRMATFLARRGMWPEAEEHARAAERIWSDDRARQGGNWVAAAGTLAEALRAQGRPAEAEDYLRAVDELLRREGRVPREGIANLAAWGQCLLELGRRDEARGKLVEAEARWAEEFGTESEGYRRVAAAAMASMR